MQILKSCNLTLGREERDPIIVDQHLVFCKNWYCAKFKSLNVCIPLCFPVPKILLEVCFRYFNVDRVICRLQLIFIMSFGCDFINAGNHMLPSVNSERRIAVPKELIDNNKKQNLFKCCCS